MPILNFSTLHRLNAVVRLLLFSIRRRLIALDVPEKDGCSEVGCLNLTQLDVYRRDAVDK